jgi:ankyrin repeat protein
VIVVTLYSDCSHIFPYARTIIVFIKRPEHSCQNRLQECESEDEEMTFVAGIVHKEMVRASLANPQGSAEAFLRAALIGETAAVSALIDKGVAVNLKDRNGRTALMEASFSGHLETVKTLLEKGADVNAADNSGWTALMEAASKGHSGIVEILLSCGADARAKTLAGWFVLRSD